MKKPFLASATILISSTLADWAYPECGALYLNDHLPPSCEAMPQGTFTNDQARNRCVCQDNGFIFNMARDIGLNCDCATLQETASDFVYMCAGTSTSEVNTTSVKSVDEMMLIGIGKTNCSLPDTTSASAGESQAEKAKLSPTDIALIILGTIAAVLMLPPALASVIQCLIWFGKVDERRSIWPQVKRLYCCCFCCFGQKRAATVVGTGDEENQSRAGHCGRRNSDHALSDLSAGHGNVPKRSISSSSSVSSDGGARV